MLVLRSAQLWYPKTFPCLPLDPLLFDVAAVGDVLLVHARLAPFYTPAPVVGECLSLCVLPDAQGFETDSGGEQLVRCWVASR